ncbi:T9SS type A sorting domain-containing protein [uncultured Tenacibaculum sp.]|uniref:T9SS type A sorting domain-containing protein n=1 Tax=uncultured Tenacibaculum sp. TaxID=174713 RepID=UPI00260EF12C|nr:T9SS type A sorting domain-containing protein [uncultured Tenacibaculum sp.]
MRKKLLFLFFSMLILNYVHAQTLAAGDIAFIGVNEDVGPGSGKDHSFTFIALKSIPAGESIYFSEEGWNDDLTDTPQGFWNGSEGHFEWTSPVGGTPCGTVVHIYESGADVFTSTSGTVSGILAGTGWNLFAGDQVIAYQSTTGARPANTVPTFITAIHLNDNRENGGNHNATTGWSLISSGGSTSHVPPGLTNGVNCMAIHAPTPLSDNEVDNIKYQGSLTGNASDLLAMIYDLNNKNTNWYRHNSTPADITPAGFSPNVTCAAPCNEPDVPTVSAQTVSCPSDDVSLTITGSLNDATEWIVYTGSCGGTEKTRGSSSTINIGKVTSTTTFYIRGEGGCVTPGSCASITVNPAVDNVKPTIASISNQTLNADASCEASLANYTSLAVVSDNCDTSPTVTQSPVAGTTITGFTTVTITVTDSSGNNNSTSFDVSLTDTTAPSIASISDQDLSANASCNVSLPDYTGLAVVSDNCDASPSITQSPVAGTTITNTTTVTLTVTDASGNNNNTSFDVSLTDTTAPSIASISNQSISVSSVCQASLPDYTGLAVVSDNCDASPSITQSPVAGTTITATTTVTLTVTDASGNNNNTSFDAALDCKIKAYVDINATGNNDGTSWTDAYTNLQEAIDEVVSNGEIWVAAGTYLPTESPDGVSTDPRDYAFHFNKDIKLYGGFAGNENALSDRADTGNTTILSGDLGTLNDNSDNAYHVLIGATPDPSSSSSNASIIDRFTVSNGLANGTGDITYSNTKYNRNNGAGISLFDSSATISNLIIENNIGDLGGGLYMRAPSSANLTNIIFKNNTANFGGGAYITTSSPTFQNVIFANNTGVVQGAGIEGFFNSFPIINNAVFVNNSSDTNGGAMHFNNNSYPTVYNSTFYNNTTGLTNGGAAIHITNGGNPLIVNSVFYNNLANGSTNNYFNDSSSETGFNNASDDSTVVGASVSLTANPFLSTNDLDGADNVFGTFDDGLRPSSGSAIINTGLNGINSIANDITGKARVINATIDIGAYEANPSVWTGTTNNDWNTASNWSTNAVPTTSSDVSIPAGITNYPTIPSAVSVTSIDIVSGASLIANAGVTGDVIYHRNIPNTDWHLVASPVSGETIEDIITNHPLATGTVNTANLGFAPYTTTSATWNYQNASSTGTLNNGQGYSVKLTSASDLTFKGSANTSSINFAVTNGAKSFNLIGNPFTAYVNSATLTASNSSILSEQTVWLWNGTDYVTHNSANPIEIAPGQGFFIEASASSNFSFNQANQSHQGTDTFQRTAPKLTFDLLVKDQNTERKTKIFFIDGKTTGFDNGYDSKMFTGVQQDFAIYTELVTDNTGKKLAIQTLPNDNLDTTIIPVGIIGKANQELTFSIQNINLPEGIEIYLEDKISNQFINLSIEDYKTTLENDNNSVGQFYIHVKAKSLSNDDFKDTPISIYKSSNNQISITGLNTNAEIHLYSLLGKEIISQKLTPSIINTITIPELSTGVYIVKVISETKEITKKITF